MSLLSSFKRQKLFGMVEDAYPAQLVTQLCSQLAQLENFNLHLISTQLGSWLASQTSISKTAPYCQQQNRRSHEFSLLFHFRFRFVSQLPSSWLANSSFQQKYLHHEVEQLQLAAQLAKLARLAGKDASTDSYLTS